MLSNYRVNIEKKILLYEVKTAASAQVFTVCMYSSLSTKRIIYMTLKKMLEPLTANRKY